MCGAVEARGRFAVEGGPWRLVVCTGCGLGRLHPLPDPGQVRAFYPDEYYGDPGSKFQPTIEAMVRVLGGRHLRFLTRSLERGARVLDVGCGRGVILGPLAERGLEVHGLEISAEAAIGADPRAEIRVADRLADAGYPEAFFDQVIVWHVLEHLADPRETVLEIRRILRPGGRLVVAVPNFSSLQARWAGAAWFHLDLPRHLYHFPLEALERLLAEAGFELASHHHFSARQNPFGWIQSALNRSRRLPRNGLYTLLHHRRRGEPAPFDARTRFWLRAWLVLLAVPAMLASVAEAALRSGATVHVVARKPAQRSIQGRPRR